MKYKLPSNRQQIKFLKQLLNISPAFENIIVINEDFYSKFSYSKTQINQMINALSHKEIIALYPPDNMLPHPHIEVFQKAFAYIPDLNDVLFKFWFPIIISSCLSAAAIVISIIALCG